MKAYWDILRELREDHDLTQAQVAAVIGTTQQVYYRYEKGINELPLHHLQTLCAYYNVSADYILGLPKGLRWPRCWPLFLRRNRWLLTFQPRLVDFLRAFW